MGECGCGNFECNYWIDAPGGAYAVAIKPPCRYCWVPAALDIRFIPQDEMEEWGLDESLRRAVDSEVGILDAILGAEELNNALRLGDTGEHDPYETPDLLTQAMHTTRKRWNR